MNQAHFEGGHEVTFENTHFVNQLFYKFSIWGPFHVAGRLTSKGMKFIKENLTKIKPIIFDEYINRNNS